MKINTTINYVMKLITVTITIVCCKSCCSYKESSECHNNFIFKNNSKIDVFVYKTNDVGLNYYKPDTNSTLRIKAGMTSEDRYKLRRCFCYENELIKDSIYLYVIDPKDINTIPWDSIKKNMIVLEKYNLGLEEMQKLNWVVTYPKTQ